MYSQPFNSRFETENLWFIFSMRTLKICYSVKSSFYRIVSEYRFMSAKLHYLYSLIIGNLILPIDGTILWISLNKLQKRFIFKHLLLKEERTGTENLWTVSYHRKSHGYRTGTCTVNRVILWLFKINFSTCYFLFNSTGICFQRTDQISNFITFTGTGTVFVTSGTSDLCCTFLTNFFYNNLRFIFFFKNFKNTSIDKYELQVKWRCLGSDITVTGTVEIMGICKKWNVHPHR